MNRTTQLLVILVALITVAGAGAVATSIGDGPPDDGPGEDGPPEEEPGEDGPPDDGAGEDGPPDDGPAEDGPPDTEASVSIEDQPSDGQTIIVDNVTVPEGGFVVIHDDTLADGEVIGSVIGVSSYLEEGTHEDVPVTVGDEFPSSSEIEVTAMPHHDTNDNEVYDFVTANGAVDGPYTTSPEEGVENETADDAEMNETGENETADDAGMNETGENETAEEGNETAGGNETTDEAGGNETGEDEPVTTEDAGANETDEEAQGEVVTDTAVIDTLGNQAPDVNLQFEDQSSDGATVTVDRVTLYRGGYVVIHNESLQESGDATGSVVGHTTYLEPGTYEDLEVTLAEPMAAGEEANLTAMPHHETNENLVYDFVLSNEQHDGPYINATEDAPVTEIASVSVENETEAPGDEVETPEDEEEPGVNETPEEEPGTNETDGNETSAGNESADGTPDEADAEA